MKLPALAVTLFIFLGGCAFNSEPKDNQGFYQISQVSELSGVYKNKGDPSGYLSAIIFGSIKEIIKPEVNHEDIEFIQVTSAENSIIVRAIRSGCAIFEKPYFLGRDFKLSNGKIIIHRDASLLTRGPGDVLVGPSYEQITLGLDEGKHGKYRSSYHSAGLVFMLLPVAFSGTDDTRFERVQDGPQEFETCSDR